jgi:hypothetical protein
MQVSICIYLLDSQGNGRLGLSIGSLASLCRAVVLSLGASVIHRSWWNFVGVPCGSVVLIIELLWISQHSMEFGGVHHQSGTFYEVLLMVLW